MEGPSLIEPFSFDKTLNYLYLPQKFQIDVRSQNGYIHPWAGEDLSLKIDERDQTI